MPIFLGDYDTTETVVIPFNTFSSDDPSASVTVTNLANTDVYIYKDGSLTERSSSAGVAVDIDIETGTGCHWITVDLSDNTDAGFYVAGSRYVARLEGITVDGATLNPFIGAWSVGCTLRPATAGRTVVVDANGLIDANTVKSGPTGSGTAQTANDNGADINAILVDTETTIPGTITTAQNDLDTITGTGGVLIGTDAMDRSGTLDINTKTITANAITATAINADAITEAKIADNALANEHFADGALTAVEITGAAGCAVSSIGANVITATAINADAITSAKIADDAISSEHLNTGALTADAFAADAIVAATLATGALTADAFAADSIVAATLATGALTADAFAADALVAATFATDSITADALAADAVNEIWAKAMSDLAAGAPSATASVLTAINYLYEAWRNQTWTTATEIGVYKDDATTLLCESTISDDGTTFKKGELRASN